MERALSDQSVGQVATRAFAESLKLQGGNLAACLQLKFFENGRRRTIRCRGWAIMVLRRIGRAVYLLWAIL
jgi:hypothetical protein